ncbi:PTS sugar transporter subunit IIA [Brachyspira sp.]|uniref:PTS sugar transporter subunit IIA n=1 Tax=Brachyspira sp. TaxID=1977261 RepID=UPI00262E5DF8|nr:PTS sugar transporter subunit IIA [Brachyspira sp.]
MAGFIDVLKEIDSINIIDNIDNWENAVKECFKPLLNKKYINDEYIQKVIDSGKELNFYYLIGKNLAMPHAKRESGVFKNGVSLLIVKNGVNFESHNNNPVYCLIGLSATDNDSHIEIMSDILDIFGGEEDGVVVNDLKKFNTKEDIINYLLSKKYN